MKIVNLSYPFNISGTAANRDETRKYIRPDTWKKWKQHCELNSYKTHNDSLKAYNGSRISIQAHSHTSYVMYKYRKTVSKCQGNHRKNDINTNDKPTNMRQTDRRIERMWYEKPKIK